MSYRAVVLMMGCLLAVPACKHTPGPDNGDGGAPPDLSPPTTNGCTSSELASLSLGDPCDTKKACACPAPDNDAKNYACAKIYDFAGLNPDVTVTLPGNMCTSKVGDCNPGSSDKCADSTGVCADLLGGEPQCWKKCSSRNKCRDGYSCFRFQADFNDNSSPNEDICVPPDPSITDCDPTAPKDSQCTMQGNQKVSDLTNGALSAACQRRGPSNVGLCAYLPCNVGKGNCPPVGSVPASCLYLNVGEQAYARNTLDQADASKDTSVGLYCFPVGDPMNIVADGKSCMYLNSCVDGDICWKGTCTQMCFQGTVPTQPGAGSAKYKNAPAKCPTGTTCQNVFNVADTMNYPGVCLPPM